MPVCTDCGFENVEPSRFCGGCGGRLAARSCPACQATSPAGHSFCGSCGASLTSDAASQRDPRDYTPRHLTERILNSRSAIEGERKRVTVLFADVRDSTALASQIDPEAWHTILDRFFEILTGGIHRFEGTVNQYTGDGVMALFGAPIAHEDHAQRACWAALGLQQALRVYGDELRREGTNLSVRIGLNSGEVVVGKIGDDLRMDYTAQGHTVMLAQRAESLAEAGRVLLTSHTQELVAGYFSLRSLGPTRLRGVHDPVELFELEGTGPLRTRLDASRAAGFSRFVGREVELSQLEAALERAQQGAGDVLGVVGEAGVGKSRLCETFVERARARGVRVYEAHCPSHARSLSGVATRELVRSLCAVNERDPPEEARRKIAGTLILIDPSFQDVLPLVFEYAGVADAERPLPTMDQASRRRMGVSFLRELTRARSERETAILLFDDLHWIDPDSDEFLSDLVTATRGTRTLVLTNFRAEYQADWMAGNRYQQIALHPFGRAESERLLDELLGRDPSLEPVRTRLLDQAGGNPFFTEEIARSLVESGAIEGSAGARRLVAEPASIVIPETVHSVLAARIDRLPEREKQLLQTASVIGRDFAGPVIESVSELGAEACVDAIDVLARGEFVHETQLFPHAEYRFKHALTQDVAYDGLLRERRRVVHGRTARALEALGPEFAGAHAGEVAQHLERAGDPLTAARWYARAAEGVGSFISAAAGRYWRRVIESTAGAEEPHYLDLRLRAIVRTLFGSWGQWEDVDAEALYEEGRQLAQQLGKRSEQIQLESAYALLVMRGDGTETEQFVHLERAMALVDAETPLALRISLHQRLSWTYCGWGSVAAAAMHAERGLALGTFDAGSDAMLLGYNAIVVMLAIRALALGWLGRLDEARTSMKEAAEAAESHPDPLSRMIRHLSDAILHQIEGAWDEAQADAEAALLATDPLDSTGWRSPVVLRLLDIHADRGAWDRVLEVYESHSEETRSAGAGFDALTQFYVAAARLQLAPSASSRALAEQARASLRDRRPAVELTEWRLHSARLSRLLEGATAAGPANADLDAALLDAEARSLRAFVPRIHEERAALAEVCGDDALRTRALEAAIAMANEIGAPRRAERYALRLRSRY